MPRPQPLAMVEDRSPSQLASDGDLPKLNVHRWRMTAHQATRATLEKVVAALQDKLPSHHTMTHLQYKDRGAGLAQAQWLHSTVSHTDPDTLGNTCRRIARVRKLVCRFDDPIAVVESAPIDGAQGMSDEEMAELFSGDASVQGDHLPALGKLVDRYVELEGEIAALDAQLGIRSKELFELRTQRLPELMRAARIVKQDMESGHKVTLGVVVVGSYPKGDDERRKASKALAVLGSEGLLKHHIEVALPTEKNEEVARIIAYLKRKKLDVHDDTSVHTMTYRAWAKEMLANEKLSPMLMQHLADLNLTVMDQVTVKLPKRR